MMFPIGTKIKKFNDKINIISHLHISDFDKELSQFYNRIPLKKEPFEITDIHIQSRSKNKSKKIIKI